MNVHPVENHSCPPSKRTLTLLGRRESAQVASTDVVMDGNILKSRNGTGSVRTSTAPLEPLTLSSQLPDDVILELKVLKITSPNGALLNLQILGSGRLPQAGSSYGTVVTLLTVAGSVTTLPSALPLWIVEELCGSPETWA